MIDKKIPKKLKNAILTLGKYCQERDCADCVFAEHPESYPRGCIFEQEHNPCWLVEDALGEEGLSELHSDVEEDDN